MKDTIEVRVSLPVHLADLKGDRSWKEVIEAGLAQSSPVVDAEFADWLAEIERDFVRYFLHMCSFADGVFMSRYRHEFGRNWLKARASSFHLSRHQLEEILNRLESAALEEAKTRAQAKPIDLSEEQLKAMREQDYAQFKLFCRYLGDNFNLDLVSKWVRHRARRYGSHFSAQQMLEDFLARYRQECGGDSVE